MQVLRDPDLGDQAPMLAAVGPMQFDVAVHRLENEFGAPVELSPTGYTVARRTDEASAGALRAMRGVDVLSRADGTMLALFESRYWLDRLVGRAARAHPRAPGRRRAGVSFGRAAAAIAAGAVVRGVEVDEVGARRRRRCSPCPRTTIGVPVALVGEQHTGGQAVGDRTP